MITPNSYNAKNIRTSVSEFIKCEQTTSIHLKFDWLTDIDLRVATAQGKQGIWFLLFPDRENTGNFVVTQGKFLRHRENIFDCIYLCKKHVSLYLLSKFFSLPSLGIIFLFQIIVI